MAWIQHLPLSCSVLEVLPSGGGATGRELHQELLTSPNDWSTDVSTVEWAARIWGPVEGLMSPGTLLKEISCPQTLPHILFLAHLVPPHVPANMTLCLISVPKAVDTRDHGLNPLNP